MGLLRGRDKSHFDLSLPLNRDQSSVVDQVTAKYNLAVA